MSISPTIYDTGELLRRISDKTKVPEVAEKQCPNCRRGMYKTNHNTLQCENCEFEEVV